MLVGIKGDFVIGGEDFVGDYGIIVSVIFVVVVSLFSICVMFRWFSLMFVRCSVFVVSMKFVL